MFLHKKNQTLLQTLMLIPYFFQRSNIASSGHFVAEEAALSPATIKIRTPFTLGLQAVEFGKRPMPAATGKIFLTNISAAASVQWLLLPVTRILFMSAKAKTQCAEM